MNLYIQVYRVEHTQSWQFQTEQEFPDIKTADHF